MSFHCNQLISVYRFLLPRLHLDLLGSQTSVRGLRKALNDLPAKLGDVYESTMTRIKGQHEEDCKLAMQTLYWIFYALRPLQIQELQHALAVELGDRGFNKEGVPSEKLLTSVCAGLISINAESNSMSLVHFTVEEYFKNTGRKWFPEASVRIAEACLTYISFDVFGGGSCGNDRELNNRLLDYPFLQYAARSWGVHAYGDPESQVKELAEEFLGDDLKLSTSIQARDCPSHRYAGFSQKYSKGVAGLQVASAFGLKEIVNLLLERGANAETWDDEGRTPLYWAAKYGHEEVVRLLLEKRADVDDAQDEVGFMALHCAAKNGHEAVVQLLLKSGASIENAWDEEGRTALHWATENGHETVVRLLLGKGADAGGLDGKLTTPLHLAAKNGHQGIVRLLLEKGADIAAKDEEGRMPLHKATENGHEAMVSLLIEQGVDVNAKGKYGWTALHEAVWYREEKLVRLLMENGADVAAKDEWGQTPLHWAAEVGHEISVRLLVENGADIATEDQRGRTALHRATKNGNRVVIQLLTSSS
jgi:ankyrin repeat protein